MTASPEQDTRRAVRTRVDGLPTEVGKQLQTITRVIHSDNTATRGLSGGIIRMQPGKVALTHLHRDSDLIVVVVNGHGATLFGDEMEPALHGPESWMFIPAGTPHTGVNLSDTEPLLAYEFRSDPTFRDDVQVLPELQDRAEQVAATLRHQTRERLTQGLPAIPD